MSRVRLTDDISARNAMAALHCAAVQAGQPAETSWDFDVNSIPHPHFTIQHPHLGTPFDRTRDVELSAPQEQDHLQEEESIEDLEHLPSFDPTPDLPQPPSLPSYDESLKTPRRKRRTRASAPAVAPLPPGTVPEDGQTRFDWRSRALSRTPHAKGQHWFPTAWRNRVAPPMTKLTEIQPLWAELQRYEEHFVPLLELEQREAEEQFMERLRDWPEYKLKKEGYMLDVMAASTGWQPKFKVYGKIATFSKVGREAMRSLPPHQFEPGQTVLLSRTDPLVDAVKDPQKADEQLKGSVLSTAKGHVRAVFPSLPEDILSGRWRLDIGFSDFSFKRQKEAMIRLNLDPVQQDMSDFSDSAPAAPPASVEDEVLATNQRKKAPDQKILLGTGLRDLLLRRFQAEYEPHDAAPSSLEELDEAGASVHAQTTEMRPSDVDTELSPSPHTGLGPRGVLGRNKLIDSWTRRYRTAEGKEPLVVEGDPHVPLNPSQTRAIAMMLGERLSLVQGPPGTGKTRVIVETIKLLKKDWQIPQPILVCAHTNVAVDNLLDGLDAHGLKALRYGTAERVPESLQHLTFDAKMMKHPLSFTIQTLQARREDILKELTESTLLKSAREAKQKQANKLNSAVFLLRRRAQFDILADADVICTTCLSSTSKMLDSTDFPFVFLDEASMATEPLSIIPLTKGSAQVAIIGDHKQLPPVIISEEAATGGLGTSLFERLIHEKNVPSIMLDTQYRMHPEISAFSSKTFYNNDLKDGTVINGKVRPGLEPPATAFLLPDPDGKPQNVTFVNHDFPESPENRSIANYHEAGRVCDIVADLLDRNPDLRGEDIGVIAPYTAQIRVISEFLTLDADRQVAFQSWLGHERAQEVADIEVRTVDGFEGREKQVIIFSTVRSNELGFIGFLADWRRLNVGITRAKRGLIILGSARTLTSARIGNYASEALPRDGVAVWRQFMGHLKERGMIMDDRGGGEKEKEATEASGEE